MIPMRAAGLAALTTVAALAIGCQAGDQRTPAALPYSFTVPPGWEERPIHVAVGPAGASCVPAEIFAAERDQYCVRPAGAGGGNYVVVSTWPAPAGVDQLDDSHLLTRFTNEYTEATESAVEEPRVTRVATRRAVVFTSEGATAEAPWARFYVVVDPTLVVQVYCEYGGRPDRKAEVLDGCDRIASTLELARP